MPFDNPLPRPIPEGHRRMEDLEFQMPQKAFAPARPAIPEGHRRLLVLADHIETNVSDAAFDMTLFRNHCGTVGCALGHADAIPEFVAAGYRCLPSGLPTVNGNEDAATLDAFFALGPHGYDHLFCSEVNNGRGRHEVAARIRAFVAEQSQAAVQAGEATP